MALKPLESRVTNTIVDDRFECCLSQNAEIRDVYLGREFGCMHTEIVGLTEKELSSRPIRGELSHHNGRTLFCRTRCEEYRGLTCLKKIFQMFVGGKKLPVGKYPTDDAMHDGATALKIHGAAPDVAPSTWAKDFPVPHDEAAAKILPAEASAITDSTWETSILSDDDDESVGFDIPTSNENTDISTETPPCVVVRVFRMPSQRRDQLLCECRELETIRAKLYRHGLSLFVGGAYIFVRPCDHAAAVSVLQAQHKTRHNVIISAEYECLLDKALRAGRAARVLPYQHCRGNDKARETIFLQPREAIVKQSFLCFDDRVYTPRRRVRSDEARPSAAEFPGQQAR